jgi:uncharacterized protein
MHSVICTLFFFGYGLNYYGELQFYQLYFVVAVIWIVQLIVSPLWLRFSCSARSNGCGEA